MGTMSQIEEVSEGENSFVAGAVMPSAVLGSGSEMEEEVSPLMVPHLRWACMLMGLGAN